MTRTARLGDICDMRSGGTPRRGVDGYYGGTIPWVTIADMSSSDGVVRDTAERITDVGLAAIGNRVFEAGTILLAMYGSVGKLAVAGCRLATNQAILGLRPRDPKMLDSRYLIRWLANIQGKLVFDARGVTQANISKGLVEKLNVPLPPLAKQCRIADILDKADSIRRKRREAIALTEELLRSTFLEMFGDPVTNPKRWPVKPLRELLDTIDSGWSPLCEARPASDWEWGVLKLGAVTFGRYDQQENKALGPGLSPVPELEVKAGDVLFSRKNTYGHIAACVFVTSTRPRLMLPDLIFRFVLSRTCGLRPETLWALLSNERMRRQVQSLAGGTAGSMPNISKERLKSVILPVPTSETQRRFAEALRSVEHTRAALEGAAAESETLFNSLVASAFFGSLGGAC